MAAKFYLGCRTFTPRTTWTNTTFEAGAVGRGSRLRPCCPLLRRANWGAIVLRPRNDGGRPSRGRNAPLCSSVVTRRGSDGASPSYGVCQTAEQRVSGFSSFVEQRSCHFFG